MLKFKFDRDKMMEIIERLENGQPIDLSREVGDSGHRWYETSDLLHLAGACLYELGHSTELEEGAESDVELENLPEHVSAAISVFARLAFTAQSGCEHPDGPLYDWNFPASIIDVVVDVTSPAGFAWYVVSDEQVEEGKSE